ncbi:MAG: hypothetical protein ACRDZV_16225 [Acidimicrobiia bacterium]
MSNPNPGGYDPGNIFKQEPAAIVAFVQSVVAVAVVAGVVDWSAETVAGVIAVVGVLLNMLYVRSVASSPETVRQVGEAGFQRGVNTGGGS